MLILFTKHYRSGCVRRTVELYDDPQLAELDAVAAMQCELSIEEIDVQPVTNLNVDPKGVTLVRAQAERSMFDATESN